MFGSKDNEIAEIKTGTLNTYYIDFVTEKRKNTNKYSPSHDFAFAIQSDASEEEFRRLLDEFNAENGLDFNRLKFLLYLSKNGFYSFSITQCDYRVPYQE